MKVILLFFLFLETSSLLLNGIDVSYCQQNINWNLVAKEKHFAIIRAGFGIDGIDSYWEQNYKGAKKAGVKVGAYWYSYAEKVEDAKLEAKSFLKALRGKQLEWPVYYDLEENNIFVSQIHNKIAKVFCDIMEQNKYYCGIYSSSYPLTYNFNDDIRKKYTIWIAHYGVSKPSYKGDYDAWQKGTGIVSGIKGDCDIDEGYKDFEPIIKKLKLNGFGENVTPIDTTTPKTPNYEIYIVQDGDCLYTIAQKLGVSINHLVTVNNIKNPNLIHSGQKLKYVKD